MNEGFSEMKQHSVSLFVRGSANIKIQPTQGLHIVLPESFKRYYKNTNFNIQRLRYDQNKSQTITILHLMV